MGAPPSVGGSVGTGSELGTGSGTTGGVETPLLPLLLPLPLGGLVGVDWAAMAFRGVSWDLAGLMASC